MAALPSTDGERTNPHSASASIDRGLTTNDQPGLINSMKVVNVEGNYYKDSHVNINNYYQLGGPPVRSAQRFPDPRAEMLAWLDAPDFRGVYQSAFEQRLGETGTWFIQTPEFHFWRGEKGSILWVTGAPGSGKTVLGSIVIHHLEATFQNDEDVGVAFAFLRYHEVQPGTSILAALLSQLIESRGKAFAMMQPVYHRVSRTKGARITVQDACSALASITASFSKVYVIIDGFDEASEEVKNELYHRLPLLGVNLLVLSRPLDHFCLEAAVNTSLRACTDDIELYITERIRLDRRLAMMLKKRPDVEPKLRKAVQTKSDGMFLVAKLQMDEITSCSNSISGLFKALGRLPSGIQEMYRLTMDRIGRQTPDDVRVAHRVLNLLLQVAKEDCDPSSSTTRQYRFPPSTEDIQCAIAANLQHQTLDRDSLTEVALILSACCGLVVEVDFSGNNRQTEYKTLRFIHSTTPECLEHAGINGWEHTYSLSWVLDLVAGLKISNSQRDRTATIESTDGLCPFKQQGGYQNPDGAPELWNANVSRSPTPLRDGQSSHVDLDDLTWQRLNPGYHDQGRDSPPRGNCGPRDSNDEEVEGQIYVPQPNRNASALQNTLGSRLRHFFGAHFSDHFRVGTMNAHNSPMAPQPEKKAGEQTRTFRIRRRNQAEVESNRNSMISAPPMVAHPKQDSPLLGATILPLASYRPASLRRNGSHGGISAQQSDDGASGISGEGGPFGGVLSEDGASDISGEGGPFSRADAAIMADAFRKMLRKPDFAAIGEGDGPGVSD